MTRSLVLLFALLFCLSCEKRDPLFCDAEEPCTNPDRPFCDVAGAAGQGTNTCISQPCSDSASCTSDIAPICSAVSGRCAGCASDDECTAAGAAPLCADDGRCVTCRTSAECTGTDAPICDTDAGQCAACTTDEQCDARDTDRGTCAPSGQCVACATGADCPSGACDQSAGECIPAARVVYVAPGGQVPPCGATAATACLTVQHGIDTVTPARDYVLVAAGTYRESVTISDKTLTLDMTSGASLGPSETPPAVLQVNSGSSLLVLGGSIQDGGTRTGPKVDGIFLIAGSSLTLVKTTVQGHNGAGIAVDGAATLEQVTVSDNGTGIAVDGATEFSMKRSIVSGNAEGGLFIRGTVFDIQNSFFVANGGLDAEFGGLRLGGNIMGSVFEFNTVARNQHGSVGDGQGVWCDNNSMLDAHSNIVWGPGMPQVSGAQCTWSYSLLRGNVPGTGNVSADPMFVDTSMGNYHLQAGSPAVDAAKPDSGVLVDFDGDVRPSGGGSDMGADEVTQ